MRSFWLAKTVNSSPAGSRRTASSAVVAAMMKSLWRQGGAINNRSAEPDSLTLCHTRPSGSLIQISGAATSAAPAGRGLFDDEGGGDPSDQRLEAHRYQAQEGECREARREGTRKVGDRKAGDADRDQ